MSDTTAGLLQVGLLVVLLAAVHVPLGDYMARVYSAAEAQPGRAWHVPRHGGRPGRRPALVGVPAQRAGLLRWSACCSCTRFQRVQQHLLLSLGFPAVKADQAWNTAASFVTNTNWQSYSGESTMGYLVQMAGLAVQNFVSAAVGHRGGRRAGPRLRPVRAPTGSATSGST